MERSTVSSVQIFWNSDERQTGEKRRSNEVRRFLLFQVSNRITISKIAPNPTNPDVFLPPAFVEFSKVIFSQATVILSTIWGLRPSQSAMGHGVHPSQSAMGHGVHPSQNTIGKRGVHLSQNAITAGGAWKTDSQQAGGTHPIGMYSC